MNYPLAPQGVYATIQGEGVLLGEPMVFVRLAGCPVNCPRCDTNYTLAERVGVDEILRRVVAADTPAVKWVWLTGGEPTIHDLVPLTKRLQSRGYRVALATAGINPVQVGSFYGGVDFVSVSPHRIDDSWVLRRGDQLNLVPGLNGLDLKDIENVDVSGFSHKFVTPLAIDGVPSLWTHPPMLSVKDCAAWVQSHSGWRLGIQAHHEWRLP